MKCWGIRRLPRKLRLPIKVVALAGAAAAVVVVAVVVVVHQVVAAVVATAMRTSLYPVKGGLELHLRKARVVEAVAMVFKGVCLLE